MPDIAQNTLYLTTPGSLVARDHLTLQVEVPVYPPELAAEERSRDRAIDWRKLSIPIHHLESICAFGQVTITPPALDLCWERGVAVNFLTENGHLHARLTGVADTSVALRRAQFRAADARAQCAAIARQIVAGKLQNSRNSILRAARETDSAVEQDRLSDAAEALARQIQSLNRWSADSLREPGALDGLRGVEGMGSATYFACFSLLLKQQRAEFAFGARSRRPPRDRINCLLSFLYALVRHDCVAALTSIGLDPFVGFLHAERPNRPALALDLMEEFRPWLADRLAVTLVNRQQVGPEDFREREGGAVEFTDAGRKRVITAYQQRKQEHLQHPLLEQNLRLGQMPFVQARLLARHLRGDVSDYVPLIPK
ncbi:MAG: type I-C CRISPR-associated endonuclease Cas1 [Planctomycetes bacterium]|nr:type I-C CRISPR-associated endonuclease Cas1 [Verrucomicrobiota bacterium]MBM4024003.1 type I-C CRISPR-associated endonuclease Cas1 [Planctomycetota bacterium]